MKGHIYALINPSLPNLVKVGKTTRTPEERAKELSAATGVPTPFIVGFSVMVTDCDGAEVFAHNQLEEKGFRLTANREFFQATLNQVVRILLACELNFNLNEAESDNGNEASEENIYSENVLMTAESLLNEGLNYFFGSDGDYRSFRKAEEKLLLAEKLGSLDSLFWLGNLYSCTEGDVYFPKKAISYFKRAMDLGYTSYECLEATALTFYSMRDYFNACVAYRKMLEDNKFLSLLGRHAEWMDDEEVKNALFLFYRYLINIYEDRSLKAFPSDFIISMLTDLRKCKAFIDKKNMRISFSQAVDSYAYILGVKIVIDISQNPVK